MKYTKLVIIKKHLTKTFGASQDDFSMPILPPITEITQPRPPTDWQIYLRGHFPKVDTLLKNNPEPEKPVEKIPVLDLIPLENAIGMKTFYSEMVFLVRTKYGPNGFLKYSGNPDDLISQDIECIFQMIRAVHNIFPAIDNDLFDKHLAGPAAENFNIDLLRSWVKSRSVNQVFVTSLEYVTMHSNEGLTLSEIDIRHIYKFIFLVFGMDFGFTGAQLLLRPQMFDIIMRVHLEFCLGKRI